MSQARQLSSFTASQPLVRSRAELKRKKDDLYASSFFDTEDGTLYRSLLGYRSPRKDADTRGGLQKGQPVTLQRDWWERFAETPVLPNGESILDRWNSLAHANFNVPDRITEMRRNLHTGDWTLPVDIIPEVFVVNPELTPAADFIARETTQDDEVVATPRTSHPDFGWGLEETTGEATYDYEDPVDLFGDLSYDVEGAGAAARIMDKMILASNNLRSAEQAVEAAFMRGAHIEQENQIIRGSDNDGDGFDGFWDLGDDASRNFDFDDGDDIDDADSLKDYTDELIDECEEAGAPLGSIAVFCDFHWHNTMRDAFTDLQIVEPAPDIDVGFATYAMRGGQVPVFKTHAIPNSSDFEDDDNDGLVAVNMEAVYLAMLQETSVRPLSKVGPQEQFGVDFYGTLVDESDGDHIIVGQIDGPASS